MDHPQQHFDVVIVGAGPAGMMAAGQAAIAGANTLLLEKTDAVGKKLSITGKKRCNLTNSLELPAFIDRFGPNGRFLRQVFHQFFREELLDFLSGLGIQTETERGGRIFPANGDAPFVTETLYRWIQLIGVKPQLRSNVAGITFDEDQGYFTINIFDNEPIKTKSVILCTGGATFTGTGSTGDGYPIARKFGHTIVPIRPALVPMKTAGSTAQKLQGLSLRNVRMQVFFDQKRTIDTFGELLFTHFGISGPIVLTHSGEIVNALEKGSTVAVSIDLKPALDKGTLDKRILRELDQAGKQQIKTMLKTLLPLKMIDVCCQQTGIDPNRQCHQVTAEERRRLREWMKSIDLEVTAPLSLESGMVTQGGIALNEIDPRTMMSKLEPGLFFAGEVMDLAADTGGFNLQAAFSTGWLAGRQAASFCRQAE